MAVNEVELGDEVLIDISGDTATADTVASGVTFHSADGVAREGTMTVPTKTSQLTNDSGFVTASHTHVKADITDYAAYDDTELRGLISGKQAALTAGSNITIVDNVISATGGGGSGTSYTAGSGISISGTTISVHTDSSLSQSGKPADGLAVGQALDAKQAKITAGTGISVVGSTVSVTTDTGLNTTGMPADSNTVGQAIATVNSAVDDLDDKIDALPEYPEIPSTDGFLRAAGGSAAWQNGVVDVLWSGSSVIGGTTFTLSQPAANYKYIVIVFATMYKPIVTNIGIASFVTMCVSNANIYHIGGTLTWGTNTVASAITVKYYESGYNTGGTTNANPTVVAIYGVR